MKDSLMGVRASLALSLPLVLFPAASGAQEPDAGVLEEITVTARKVAENLQDTPIAITVLSAKSLENRQVFRTDMLDQVVPNLQFSNDAPLAGNNSSSQIFIRGIGQTDPTSTVDPGVGLYIDDVYMGTAVGGTVRVGAGSDRLAEFFGAIDAPFSESLKSRFSFGLRKQDGYVTRHF
jgi:iron complex outermembrane receptor protein